MAASIMSQLFETLNCCNDPFSLLYSSLVEWHILGLKDQSLCRGYIKGDSFEWMASRNPFPAKSFASSSGLWPGDKAEGLEKFIEVYVSILVEIHALGYVKETFL